MLVHWIWFSRCGISDWQKAQLLQYFSDPEEIYFADSRALDQAEGMSAEIKAALSDKTLADAEQILQTCRREGIHILTLQDAAYPVRLKNIPDPPAVLYYKGMLPDFDSTAVIGVVGTRKASAYGMQAAKRLGYQIGCCGGLVVSGLAEGIDAMAMSGALEAGCAAVGVLGCGIDIVYPRCNRSLFQDTQRYGCILSEFAPGMPPAKWAFPRRNRIISGLSNGVLVVEAPERSGALITARHALEQGRDVFVVPGNIDIPTCIGSNRLLRDGGIPVSCGWDIMGEYEALYPDKIRKVEAGSPPPRQGKAPGKTVEKACVSENENNLKKENDKKGIDKEQSSPYIDVNDILPKLSQVEQRIASVLVDGERLVDDVIAESGLTSGDVLATLTTLELKKIIVRHPGRRISLK